MRNALQTIYPEPAHIAGDDYQPAFDWHWNYHLWYSARWIESIERGEENDEALERCEYHLEAVTPHQGRLVNPSAQFQNLS
jgi:hypothetical protein